MKRGFLFILTAIVFSTLTLPSQANIYIDETFEGASALVDQNWPVQDDNTTAPTPEIVAVKGINIRAGGTGSLTPKPTITSSGSIVSTRYFLGAKSYQLESGESVALAPVDYNGKATGEVRLIQFAVSTDAASAALTSGTIIGHFKHDWSVVTAGTVETSAVFNFVANGNGGVDIICANNAATVATLAPGPGQWALLSFITQIRPDPPATGGHTGTWQAQDPFTLAYKGPVTGTEPTDFPVLNSGIHVYCNSKTETFLLLPDEIGAGWGNDNDGDNSVLNSAEISWEIKALNGGTLFIDDLYWDAGYKGDFNQKCTQEMAARMKDFNQATSEPSGPPPAAASSTWQLLE